MSSIGQNATAPALVPRWISRFAFTTSALAGVVFLALWRMEVDRHDTTRHRNKVAAARVASFCSSVKGDFEHIASSMRRAPDAATVDLARHQADLLVNLALGCLPPKATGMPTLSLVAMTESLDKAGILQQTTNELAAWSERYAAALADAERLEWGAKEREDADR